MPQFISLVPVLQVHVVEYFWLMTGKTFRPKELHNTSSILLGKWGWGSFVSRNNRTIILTENQGERGRGHLSNNDSNCRTRECGRGHLSLGTMILGVDRGREGGSLVSGNNNSILCAAREREGEGWGVIFL